MTRLPVLEVRDELVICGGEQPSAVQHGGAPGVAGTHQLLRPAFHLSEIAASVEIKPGDSIERDDNGKLTHVPRPKG